MFQRGGNGETLSIRLVEHGADGSNKYHTLWTLADSYVDQFEEDGWHRGEILYKVPNQDLDYHVREFLTQKLGVIF